MLNHVFGLPYNDVIKDCKVIVWSSSMSHGCLWTWMLVDVGHSWMVLWFLRRSQEPKPTGTAGISSGLQARIRDFVAGGEPQGESSVMPVSLPDLRRKTGGERDANDPSKKRMQSERNVDTDTGTWTEGDVTRSPSTPPLAQPLALDGRLRTVRTFPSFPQALAEARQARYLRHRGQPLSERELSVGEIFGRTPLWFLNILTLNVPACHPTSLRACVTSWHSPCQCVTAMCTSQRALKDRVCGRCVLIYIFMLGCISGWDVHLKIFNNSDFKFLIIYS